MLAQVDFRWRYTADRFDDLGLLLAGPQRDLAEQREGLALTLLRLEDQSCEGCGEFHTIPHHLPDGTQRNAVLPVVIDFSQDHVLDFPSGTDPWHVSDQMEEVYGPGWRDWHSLIGLIDSHDPYAESDMVVRRLWDCWPIDDVLGEVFTRHAEHAWGTSRYSLWGHYMHLREQFDPLTGELRYSHIYGNAEEQEYLRQEYEHYGHALFDENGVVRPPEDPEDQLHLPPEAASIWRRLLRSSTANWRALSLEIEPTEVYKWSRTEGAFCQWF